MGRLDGKVAIITGAASGLGAACSKLFAQEGAKVIVADIHDARGAEVVSAIKEAGGEATYVHTDVTSSEEVQRAVQTAEERYGQLNIMVANAGVMGAASTKKTEEMVDEEWDFVFDLNSTGVLRCFKYAIPAIQRAGGGAMSATASPSGLNRWGGTGAAYGASKAAVIRLVKETAYECLKDNIRVNSVCPGAMQTRLSESFGLPPEEMEKRFKLRAAQSDAETPYYSRSRDPMEVAYAHLFLCSDEGSFVNGHNLVADGGFDFRGTEGR